MKWRPKTYRVEVTFLDSTPPRRVSRASGVSDVDIHGSTLRCQVAGSFQPFLESLQGYEVLSLESVPALEAESFPTSKEVNDGTIR